MDVFGDTLIIEKHLRITIHIMLLSSRVTCRVSKPETSFIAYTTAGADAYAQTLTHISEWRTIRFESKGESLVLSIGPGGGSSASWVKALRKFSGSTNSQPAERLRQPRSDSKI